VLAKRTYALHIDGTLEPLAEQEELCGRVPHATRGRVGKRPLRHDDDHLCLAKDGVDWVVQGTAHSRRGAVDEMRVSVRISDGQQVRHVEMHVVGDRRVEMQGSKVAFSAPTPFTEMSLTYDRAYGGHDVWSETERPDPALDEMAKVLPVERDALHRYLYPRNPSGCGYIVHRDQGFVGELSLPNLERPDQRLRPEHLIVGDPHRWHRAPVPAGFDWRDQFWFPRCALLGFAPRCDREIGEALYEIATGELPRELIPGDLRCILEQRYIGRWAQGASEGLVSSKWSGRERVTLSGMHPERDELAVGMPAERPRVVVQLPKGGNTELNPAVKTVVIRPTEGTMVLVWCAKQAYRGHISEDLAASIQFGVEWR
jgi:hypothetical protein